MCFNLRILWTVLQNLVVRMVHEIEDIYYGGCCTKRNNQNNNQNLYEQPDFYGSENYDDYVVVRNHPTSEQSCRLKSIEDEHFFRAVDRLTAEDILINRVDGSCLVRPFKDAAANIKYIASVYAQQNFFHLYIRRIDDLNKYGIGLEKPFEKLFNTPNDIINYYRLNKLLCTNKNVSISLVLIPIS